MLSSSNISVKKVRFLNQLIKKCNSELSAKFLNVYFYISFKGLLHRVQPNSRGRRPVPAPEATWKRRADGRRSSGRNDLTDHFHLGDGDRDDDNNSLYITNVEVVINKETFNVLFVEWVQSKHHFLHNRMIQHFDKLLFLGKKFLTLMFYQSVWKNHYLKSRITIWWLSYPKSQ